MTTPEGAARRRLRGMSAAAPPPVAAATLRVAPSAVLAIGFGLLALVRLGPEPLVLAGAGYLAAVTAPLCAADWQQRRLPDAWVLPGYAFAAVGLAWQALAGSRMPGESLVCAGVTLGFFVVLAIGGGVGLGDVKLAGLLALVLGGLSGTWAVIAATGAAFVSAGGVAIVGVIVGRPMTREGIPFGPYLLGGFWCVLLLG